jgi:hypothetical protein
MSKEKYKDYKKLDQLLHKLQETSVDRMCDGDGWKTVDHRLLVETLDAVKKSRKEWVIPYEKQ